MSRPCQANINLDALQHNFAVAKSLAPHSKTAAVVKANAYGHGATECALALEGEADALAVACIDEAIALRSAGVTRAILLLEGVFRIDELQQAADNNFWIVIHEQWQIDSLLSFAKNYSGEEKLSAWLKIDTGMHRLGFEPSQSQAVLEQLRSIKCVNDDIVLCSHFACADTPEAAENAAQLTLFDSTFKNVNYATSIANSAALIALEESRRDWNRPGIMLYGSSPFQYGKSVMVDLRPVMTFESEVISVSHVRKGHSVGYSKQWRAERDSLIATVAVGYGDGYPLNAPNATPVMIDGVRAPLAGRVSMDMITVDVTDLPSVTAGSKVELWGEQLSVNEVAMHCNTISYELLTRMPLRAKRQY